MSAPTSRDPHDARLGLTQRLPHAESSTPVAVRRTTDAACLRELADGARIVTGNAGDHPLILQLLVQARQAALAEDFQSRLDEPGYRPANRLLLRRQNLVLGHVHVASHTALFDRQRTPIVKLEDFASLPEYGKAGYEDQLIAAAESIAADEGAVIAIVHADRPECFQRQGWSLVRGQGHTRANARAVLAQLDAHELARRRRRRPSVEVRTWRHFELDHVREIYDIAAADLWGPVYRSEPCWQWLIGRKAQDQVLLAVDNRKPAATNGHAEGRGEEQIVGYAAVSGSCIIEMMTLPEFAAASVPLLARACRDALDRDHHSISLYTSATDPLHELLVTAGGAWIADKSSVEPRWMMKLLSPERWVERSYPLWRGRARAAGVPRPLEFGLVAGERRFRFTLTRRSSRLERTEDVPAERVECDGPTLESLLVGNLPVTAAVARGQLRLSHPEIGEALAALFPARLFWQSPLEQMRL